MLRIVPHTVPRVGRSDEHFPTGFELYLLQLGELGEGSALRAVCPRHASILLQALFPNGTSILRFALPLSNTVNKRQQVLAGGCRQQHALGIHPRVSFLLREALLACVSRAPERSLSARHALAGQEGVRGRAAAAREGINLKGAEDFFLKHGPRQGQNLALKPETLNHRPLTLNPEPKTLRPEPQTLNMGWTVVGRARPRERCGLWGRWGCPSR